MSSGLMLKIGLLIFYRGVKVVRYSINVIILKSCILICGLVAERKTERHNCDIQVSTQLDPSLGPTPCRVYFRESSDLWWL